MNSASAPDLTETPYKLLASGWVHLSDGGPVEVRREMLILGQEGAEIGRVAAVVLDDGAQAITHVLLRRLGPEFEYRLAPLALVEQVTETAV